MSNWTGERIKVLRTDNGGEYTSTEFSEYLKMRGIRHELTVPYTSEQNGVSERINRTLQEMAVSMLAHSRLPKSFWADALSSACHIRNRLPVSPLNVSPYQKWFGVAPNVDHVRVFGCVAYSLKPDVERKKMEPKTEKLCFIGYPIGTKGYRLYDHKKHRVIVRRDLVFNEDDFDYHSHSTMGENFGHNQVEMNERPNYSMNESTTDESNERAVNNDETSQRRSHRNHRAPERYGECIVGKEWDEVMDNIEAANKLQHLSNMSNTVCIFTIFMNPTPLMRL